MTTSKTIFLIALVTSGFAMGVTPQQSFFQSATALHYTEIAPSVSNPNDPATITALSDCFKTGNCSSTPANEVYMYPVKCSGSGANACTGCWGKGGGSFTRLGGLNAANSCPNGQIKVFVGYRSECPSGISPCTNGRLLLGCSFQTIGQSSVLYNKECFGGSPIMVDPTNMPSVCDAGQYRDVLGNCVPCAAGTYKSTLGDSQSLCLACMSPMTIPNGTLSDPILSPRGITSQSDCQYNTVSCALGYLQSGQSCIKKDCTLSMNYAVTNPDSAASPAKKGRVDLSVSGNQGITSTSISSAPPFATLMKSNASGSAFSEFFDNLAAGTYTVTAQDTICSRSATVSLTDSPSCRLALNVTVKNPTQKADTTSNSDGSLSVTISGANGATSSTVTTPAGYAAINPSGNPLVFSNLPANTYGVKVFDSVCSSSIGAVLTATPPAASCPATPGTLTPGVQTYAVTGFYPSCFYAVASCWSGYTLSGGTCVANPISCPAAPSSLVPGVLTYSVSGTSPSCTYTAASCWSGYTLSAGTCVANPGTCPAAPNPLVPGVLTYSVSGTSPSCVYTAATCWSGYTLSGGTCVANPGTCAPAPNPLVAGVLTYNVSGTSPSCVYTAATCWSGYTLSAGTCVAAPIVTPPAYSGALVNNDHTAEQCLGGGGALETDKWTGAKFCRFKARKYGENPGTSGRPTSGCVQMSAGGLPPCLAYSDRYGNYYTGADWDMYGQYVNPPYLDGSAWGKDGAAVKSHPCPVGWKEYKHYSSWTYSSARNTPHAPWAPTYSFTPIKLWTPEAQDVANALPNAECTVVYYSNADTCVVPTPINVPGTECFSDYTALLAAKPHLSRNFDNRPLFAPKGRICIGQPADNIATYFHDALPGEDGGVPTSVPLKLINGGVETTVVYQGAVAYETAWDGVGASCGPRMQKSIGNSCIPLIVDVGCY